MDCSPLGSSVERGFFQARILEWVAICFSRGCSELRDWTCISCIESKFEMLTLPCTGSVSSSFFNLLFVFYTFFHFFKTLCGLIVCIYFSKNVIFCFSFFYSSLMILVFNVLIFNVICWDIVNIILLSLVFLFYISLSFFYYFFSINLVFYYYIFTSVNFLVAVVQLLNYVQLFVTPWTAAYQASLSFTIFQSLLKLMSNESVMPSNHPLSLSSPFALSLDQHQGLSQQIGSLHQMAKVFELQL